MKRLKNLQLDFDIRNVSDFVDQIETMLTEPDEYTSLELSELKKEESLRKLEYLKHKRQSL